jgi:DNA-binding MarR family transcriptional regulator
MTKEDNYPPYVLELEQRLIMLFRTMKEQHVQDAAELKLSMPQFVCLWVISKLGKFKMSDLAIYLSLSYASATNLINRLVDAGLVTRYDDPDDRRVVIVELSSKGADITSSLRKKHLDKLMNNCQALTPEVRETMINGFTTLTEMYTRKESADPDKKIILNDEMCQ